MAKVSEFYALTNPICCLTDKEPKDFSREDLLKVIKEKEIERIAFHYTALDGKIKELKIPVSSRAQAEVILAEGERADGSSLFKGMIDAGQSDLYVLPVYKSAFINPFNTKSLDFMCRFIDRDGNFAPFAPDNILLKALEQIKKKTGLELHALGELEFFLLGNEDNSNYALPRQQGYHASAPFAKGGKILNEMLRYITQISGNVKYAHNEVGSLDRVVSDFDELNNKSAEQIEIEFLPTPIDEAADALVLARWIIRNVAHKHNKVATFVPKLETGDAGNGMHVHLALMKNGVNQMTNAKGELSDKANMLIGGLAHYATSLTAFGNMCSASYLRLVPHQEAPTKVCWSEMNRSALIRVPLGWSKLNNLALLVNPNQKTKLQKTSSRQTVELRTPDGSANIHLLLSGISMAAEWGLTNKESLKIAKNTHVNVNIHDLPTLKQLEELPTSCSESSEILLQHKNLYERNGIFPSVVINYVAKVLQNENDRNLNKRLMALSEEERLKESRRIMHRAIHKH